MGGGYDMKGQSASLNGYMDQSVTREFFCIAFTVAFQATMLALTIPRAMPWAVALPDPWSENRAKCGYFWLKKIHLSMVNFKARSFYLKDRRSVLCKA